MNPPPLGHQNNGTACSALALSSAVQPPLPSLGEVDTVINLSVLPEVLQALLGGTVPHLLSSDSSKPRECFWRCDFAASRLSSGSSD